MTKRPLMLLCLILSLGACQTAATSEPTAPPEPTETTMPTPADHDRRITA